LAPEAIFKISQKSLKKREKLEMVLRRNGMNKRPATTSHKAREEKEAHGEIETEHLGYSLSYKYLAK
jgi:hypothetical protein